MRKKGPTKMCKTKTKQWGFRATNRVTKIRVTVGPFVSEEAAYQKMKASAGLQKNLVEATHFDFTPSWNGWEDVEYKGVDVVYKLDEPVIGG